MLASSYRPAGWMASSMSRYVLLDKKKYFYQTMALVNLPELTGCLKSNLVLSSFICWRLYLPPPLQSAVQMHVLICACNAGHAAYARKTVWIGAGKML